MDVFDLATERPISLSEAADYLPRKQGGKKLSIATISRWILDGHKGVRLEGARIGDAICTSKESLRRFAERLSGSTATRTQTEACASHERAKQYLANRKKAKQHKRQSPKRVANKSS